MNFLKSSPSLDLSSYFFDIDPWAWLASLYSHHRKESRLYSLFCFSVRYVPYIYQSIWNEKKQNKFQSILQKSMHQLIIWFIPKIVNVCWSEFLDAKVSFNSSLTPSPYLTPFKSALSAVNKRV